MYTIKELERSLPQQGTVTWIGIRTEARGPVEEKDQVQAMKDQGLKGDHYSGRPGSKRQVTIIQQEHLQAVASYFEEENIDPKLTRRNIVTKGINLNALKDRKFQIGEVLLEGTGDCAPCSRMEENLGAGGWNAMRGHGGLTAKIIKGGTIAQGDKIRLVVD